jgi:PEP-CTERM motif
MRNVRILMLVGALLLVTISASAGNIVVYVGYADNLRPSGFFPTPWLGSPGVVSETPTGQSLDTGAIRIDNNTGAAITISNFTATFNAGGYVFNFWSSLVIPNGETGIFTQTGSYNFDTSDFGYFGGSVVNVDATHPYGGCTNPQGPIEIAGCLAYQPVVSFSVNGGAANSLTDSGHVLDTFGYDLINLPAPYGDGNESINWNLIGTIANRGGTPEPGTLLLLGSGLLGAIGYGRRRLGL